MVSKSTFKAKSKVGDLHTIEGQWWVIVGETRLRLTLKRAETEMQAIRLSLGLTQMEMKSRLKISQGYYSQIESGVAVVPPLILKAVRAMKSPLDPL